jgi:O-antigen/teichoic acid export membrane protein
VVLTAGRVAGYVFSFLRNLILARLLAKTDYGVAAVFSMAMTLLEIGGRMAFGVQIVQSKDGDTPEFQASAQALGFVAGLGSALLIAGLSVPMARLFGLPQTWWAFALLAIVPLSQGLGHMDISRRQREFDFLPLILVDIVPQILITLAAWPMTLWLGDFRVILWLMIGKAVAGTAMTFLFARQPYRWGWEPVHIRSMLTFGWPMVVTGWVMFGSQQADQMLVGAVFSLEALAGYALAFSLVSIPWFIMGQVGSSLMLPLLSRAQDDPERFRRQYRACADATSVAGVAFTLPLILIGEQMVTVLYGEKYRGTGGFMAVLGAAAAVRFLRFAPTVAASARADTLNHLYSNLWRGTSLPLMLGAVAMGGTPLQIAACALMAETMAVVYSMVRLWRVQNVPLHENCRAVLYVTVLVTVELGLAFGGAASWSIGFSIAAAMLAFTIVLGIAWFLFPEMALLLAQALRSKSRPRVEQPNPN